MHIFLLAVWMLLQNCVWLQAFTRPTHAKYSTAFSLTIRFTNCTPQKLAAADNKAEVKCTPVFLPFATKFLRSATLTFSYTPAAAAVKNDESIYLEGQTKAMV